MAGRRASMARGRGGNSIPTQDTTIEERLTRLEERGEEIRRVQRELGIGSNDIWHELCMTQEDLAKSKAEVEALNKKHDELRALVERAIAGGNETNNNRRRSDLLSFLPGEQLVNDSEIDNGQKSAEPAPSALSDMMDALVPSWPKDGRMSPQKQKHQQEDQQPPDDSLLLAPDLPKSARVSTSIEDSGVQQEQQQQQQPRVDFAPVNRRKSVRFKSPDETFHDQAQGASTSLAAHLSSPDPLSTALPLRHSATSTPKAAGPSAATATQQSNRLQRAQRASRGGRSLTAALGLVEKGELNDDDNNKISYPELTTKAPRDSPYVSVSEKESSSAAIAILHAAEDSDTIAVAPRKSTRKRVTKDFGDVEVHGWPKKQKSAK